MFLLKFRVLACAMACGLMAFVCKPVSAGDKKPATHKAQKQPAVIRLVEGTDTEKPAESLRKLFPATTVIVALPDESALLVYVTEADLEEMRQILAGCVLATDVKKFEFRMKDAKWDDVLAWYAEKSGLTLITSVKPKGTFTFEPPTGKEFTLDEIANILDDALEPHGLLLNRRRWVFFLREENERDDKPRRTALADLPGLSKREHVNVIIPLRTLKAERIIPEIQKLLSPVGAVTKLEKSKAVLVADCVDNLRRIVEMVRNADERASDVMAAPKKYALPPKGTKWEDVLAWYAKASGLKADVKQKPIGTFALDLPKDREFTLGEITDLINQELAKHKLYLTRGRGSFVVVGGIEKVDPKFIPTLELRDLSTRGGTELVEIAIPLTSGDPAEEIVDELKKLLTPAGEILYAKGKWIIIRDTVGNILRFRAVLESCCRWLTSTRC